MKTYPKGLASCKLNEPATVKICGATKTLHEIAKALKGDVNGEWINIPGPGHSSDDRSLGIKFLQNAPDGFIVSSLSDDDPGECRRYFKAKLAEMEFSFQFVAAQTSRKTVQIPTWIKRSPQNSRSRYGLSRFPRMAHLLRPI
jgi:hypothetical protein